jgi:dTDP-4-dehydrorhamnose 3,5-epimerase-like enzyme
MKTANDTVQVLQPSCNLNTVRDGRGIVLTWVPPEPILEFNIVRYRPGAVRGMHYHEHFVEYSLVTEGTGVYVYRSPNEGDDAEQFILLSEGMCLRTPTHITHTIYAVSDLTIIAMLTKPWDECDPPIVQVGTVPKPERLE